MLTRKLYSAIFHGIESILSRCKILLNILMNYQNTLLVIKTLTIIHGCHTECTARATDNYTASVCNAWRLNNNLLTFHGNSGLCYRHWSINETLLVIGSITQCLINIIRTWKMSWLFESRKNEIYSRVLLTFSWVYSNILLFYSIAVFCSNQ